MTPEEVDPFLAHDPEDRLFALWVTAVYSGMRPAEILALRWDDLDFDGATLKVQRVLARVGKDLFYWALQGGE